MAVTATSDGASMSSRGGERIEDDAVSCRISFDPVCLLPLREIALLIPSPLAGASLLYPFSPCGGESERGVRSPGNHRVGVKALI